MKVEINGREIEIHLRDLGHGRFMVRFGDREQEADARRTPDGAWHVLLAGKSYEIYVEPEDLSPLGDQAPTHVMAGGALHSVRIDDPRRHSHAGTASLEHEGWAEIRAPMPGKVVAVLAAQGESVEAGQGLVVVAAMKMENEFSSPKGGKVVELAVEPGQAVEAGELLAAVE